MERGIYTSATGMQAAETWMETIAHNLANASTTGYKRDVVLFGDALERAMYADGGNARFLGTLGSGGTRLGQFTLFDTGLPTPTGNDLDVAITTAEGLFAVQTPDGASYTRDGSFELGPNRELTNKSGFPVLDANGSTITMPAGKVDIAPDGSVSVDGKFVAKLGVWNGEFVKSGSGLYTGANVSVMNDSRLAWQAVEASNVNAIDEMISMIKLNRAFEMAQKSATTQDEMSQQLLQILQGL